MTENRKPRKRTGEDIAWLFMFGLPFVGLVTIFVFSIALGVTW